MNEITQYQKDSMIKTHPYPAQRIRCVKKGLSLPLGVDGYINY